MVMYRRRWNHASRRAHESLRELADDDEVDRDCAKGQQQHASMTTLDPRFPNAEAAVPIRGQPQTHPRRPPASAGRKQT